jgi:hypothetical protein
MLNNEIIELHKRITARLTRTQEEIVSSAENEDGHLANLANSAGWEILKSKMDGMVAELLEPVAFSDETPLDVRGAVNEAKWFCLKFIREIIQQVEATKAAKTIQKEEDEIKEEGISE